MGCLKFIHCSSTLQIMDITQSFDKHQFLYLFFTRGLAGWPHDHRLPFANKNIETHIQ